MKRILLVALTALLLTSCKGTPKEVEKDTPYLPKNDQIVVEKTKEEVKELLVEEISNMSLEERATDFINALNSGNTDRIDCYIQSLSTQEFSKAKFDAEIVSVKEKSDIPYVEFEADVKLTITESETVAFENGTFNYSLLIRDFPDPGFVVYFGPSDRIEIIRKNNIPTKDIPDVYSAYYSVLPLFDYISLEPSEEKIYEANRFEIAHAVVHTIHAVYDGEILLTKEQFKDIARDIYGIEDVEITDWLDFKYPSEDGVYSIYCAHDGIVTFEVYEGIKRTESGFKLTFSLYSDSAYIVKCGTLVVTFEENKNSDFMRIVDIDLEKHLDYPVYAFAP